MKKPVSFRLDPELVEALESNAKDQNRSLTNLVETILKESINGKVKTISCDELHEFKTK